MVSYSLLIRVTVYSLVIECILHFIVRQSVRSTLLHTYWSSLALPPSMAQMVNNLPAVQETWVWSLGQEDPLEKGMRTHSSVLAWEIPWTEEPGGLQFMKFQNTQHWMTNKQPAHLYHLSFAELFFLDWCQESLPSNQRLSGKKNTVHWGAF